MALFERSQKYLGSISKLHNSADIDLKHLGSKDFVRLDFSNRDFMQKITAPFAQVALPICYVTSLDYPIVNSIQENYSDFNFFLSCGKLSSILYMIHSDGFLKSFKIPIGLNMYYYPIDNIIEFDELLTRLSSVIGKIIKDTNLQYKKSNIIISGLDVEFESLKSDLFSDSNLTFISLSNYIKSLKLKSMEKLPISRRSDADAIQKLLFSSAILSSTMKIQ